MAASKRPCGRCGRQIALGILIVPSNVELALGTAKQEFVCQACAKRAGVTPNA